MEYDAHGTAVGIVKRYTDPKGPKESKKPKKAICGSSRGLTLPAEPLDPSAGILLAVEGASDVLACLACGIPAVGRPGAMSKADVLAEFVRQLPATTRVYVVGENDQKPDGSHPGKVGAERTARVVADATGRTVAIAYPPNGAKDVREWVVRQTEGKSDPDWGEIGRKLLAGLDATRTEVSPQGHGESGENRGADEDETEHPMREDDFDPWRIGRLLLDPGSDEILRRIRLGLPDGYGDFRFNYIHHCGQWWKLSGHKYVAKSDRDLMVEAFRAARKYAEGRYQRHLENWKASRKDGEKKAEPPKVEEIPSAVVSDAVQVARAMAHLDTQIRMPALLTTVGQAPGGVPFLIAADEQPEFVAVANGLIDVGELMKTGAAQLLPLCRMYFTASTLAARFDPEAGCPKFLDFLDKVTGGDEELQSLLQEVTGYFLLPDTSFQKFFVLIGPGGNGKSTFLAAVEAVLGKGNISAVPLEKFGERFHLASTVGKLVNAVAEVGKTGRVAEAVLKQFVAGDTISMERKNKDPVDVVPTARLLLSCNELPHFEDRTEGTWRRFVPIPFEVTIRWAEKVRGMDKPQFWEAEAAGILNWALGGLHRLRTTGAFTEAAACEAAKTRHRGQCDPHREFIRDHLAACPGGQVGCYEAYSAYSVWCGRQQVRPLSDNKFGELIQSAVPGINRSRPRDGEHRRYAYQGIYWAGDRPHELLTEYDREQRRLLRVKKPRPKRSRSA